MEELVKRKLSPKILLLAVAAVLACVAVLIQLLPQKENLPQISITTTLEKIAKSSELSTAVFQYQGIVEVPNQKNLEKIDYYIYYQASVYAGIDFSQVKFKENKENKTITATLPEVRIQDTVVDPDSLDFMFQSKKSNNISVLELALTACENDIRQECNSESALLDIARMNAENAVRALTEPVMNNLCKDYTLVFEDEPEEIQEGGAENEG